MTLSVSVLGTEGTAGEAVGGREEQQQQQQQQQLPAIALHLAEDEGGSPDNRKNVAAEPRNRDGLPEVTVNVHSPDVGSDASSEAQGLDSSESKAKINATAKDIEKSPSPEAKSEVFIQHQQEEIIVAHEDGAVAKDALYVDASGDAEVRHVPSLKEQELVLGPSPPTLPMPPRLSSSSYSSLLSNSPSVEAMRDWEGAPNQSHEESQL